MPCPSKGRRGDFVTTQLAVVLPNKPGRLAEAAGVIGRHNVNIRAFAAVAAGKSDEVRFITDDADEAERALKEAGYKVRRSEVVTLRLTNTPGELAVASEKLARAGINIDGAYIAASADGERFEVIFEVVDLDGARAVLNGA
jgi:hypothetical protein